MISTTSGYFSTICRVLSVEELSVNMIWETPLDKWCSIMSPMMSLSFLARMVATILSPGVIVSIDYHKDEMKILILCSYYQRPKLVRNALSSILAANEHHQDWELAFGDDGSIIPGKPIVEEVLKDHLDKIRIVESGMNLEDKLKHGLVLGRMANEAISLSSADIAIILCDDDELHPEYLKNISEARRRRKIISRN